MIISKSLINKFLMIGLKETKSILKNLEIFNSKEILITVIRTNFIIRDFFKNNHDIISNISDIRNAIEKFFPNSTPEEKFLLVCTIKLVSKIFIENIKLHFNISNIIDLEYHYDI